MTVTKRRIEPEIIDILETAEVDGNEVRLTCGQLDRKTYTRTNEVLESLGGKWNRKAKAHIFESDPSDSLEQAVAFGVYVKPDDMGFFPTPQPLADELAALFTYQWADDYPFDVLEPSAGSGNLVRAVYKQMPEAKVTAVEIQSRHCDKLQSEFPTAQVIEADFLSLDDRAIGMGEGPAVLMNPPFARRQDIDHVMHAANFLTADGQLIAIMSAGVAFREDRKTREFWSFMACNFYEVDCQPLPEQSFRESGTDVRAVLVTGVKAS